MPEMFQKPGETWREHLTRLEREKTSVAGGLRYNLARQLFNAADCGAPQRRERVFIVGFRSRDQDVHWSFPWTRPTSQDALLHAQWISGDYWDRHRISKKARGAVPQRLVRRVETLRGRNDNDGRLPWLTVRDALRGLPEPRADGRETDGFSNHRRPARRAGLCRSYRLARRSALEGVKGRRSRRAGRREHDETGGRLGAVFHGARSGPDPGISGRVRVPRLVVRDPCASSATRSRCAWRRRWRRAWRRSCWKPTWRIWRAGVA